MKKLTIAFYQNPEAEHIIHDWAGTEEIQSKTLSIEFLDKSNIVYHLKDEIVFCTPISQPHMKFVKNVLLPENKYYKTLIFGKTTSADLSFIEEITRKLENNVY